MPCVTLLSDLGPDAPGIATAKGILMQHLGSTPIIDVTHNISNFHVEEAAYLLRATYRHFPPETCHVILFDVFSERGARLVHLNHEGYQFLAADNGVLPLAFGAELEGSLCHTAAHPGLFHEWIHTLGRTAKTCVDGKSEKAGLPACKLKSVPLPPRPDNDARSVDCYVIHIDRFENVVLNITKTEFERVAAGRPFRIRLMRSDEITTISTNYYEVRQGDKLCRFNSAGHLEICINGGGAASLFGFRLHRHQNMMYTPIKILFG